MVGTVYLRTDRFEVKLEGITFKAKEFESLCCIDFLFPEGKVRIHRPVVGIDIMQHPRDPSVVLLLLCLGTGCVIIRFKAKQRLPDSITKFLTDERICFVGFGIHEKKDIFPFEQLGLNINEVVDVGCLAAKFLDDPKLKKCELAELARRVLRINNMVGLAEACKNHRHQQIKICICELFISSVIAMMLLDPNNKNRFLGSPNNTLGDVKKLDFPKMSRMQTMSYDDHDAHDHDHDDVWVQGEDRKEYAAGDEYSGKVVVSVTKKPLKGILKSPSFNMERSSESSTSPSKSKAYSTQTSFSSACTSKGQPSAQCSKLKRANSKGHNVSFV